MVANFNYKLKLPFGSHFENFFPTIATAAILKNFVYNFHLSFGILKNFYHFRQTNRKKKKRKFSLDTNFILKTILDLLLLIFGASAKINNNNNNNFVSKTETFSTGKNSFVFIKKAYRCLF